MKMVVIMLIIALIGCLGMIICYLGWYFSHMGII